MPMKWIKVEDGLPEPEDEVVIYRRDIKTISFGFVYANGDWRDLTIVDRFDDYLQITDVTHWMLPDLPEDV